MNVRGNCPVGVGANFTIVLWVGALLLGQVVEASDLSIASERHYAAMLRSQECSVYRSLALKTTRKRDEHAKVLSIQKAESAVRRQAVESCARENGWDGSSKDAEDVIAELCPVEYDQWVETGMRGRMTSQDVNTTDEELLAINEKLRSCRPLPAPPITAAPPVQIFSDSP